MPAPNHPQTSVARTVSTVIHRFDELIAGRSYAIEVAPVGRDRWRAYIARLPGVPTALMPFYGTTPEAAAEGLRAWLRGAYEGVRRPTS